MFIGGTALTWSSPEIPILSNTTSSPFKRKLSTEEETWVSSLVTLGAAFGPFFFTFLADKMGRKYTLLSMGVPFLVSYIMLAFGQIVELFYVARFVMGITVGGVFTLVPIYAGEVAKRSNRGTLGFLMGSAVCSGLLFSCALGPYVSVKLFNLVLAAINEPDLAKEALQKLRGSSDDIDEEFNEIQRKFKEDERGSFSDIFRSKGLIKAFVTSVGLLIFQQLSGINAVLFYGQKIFQEVGSKLPPEVCTIIIASVQFVSSFIAPLIGDKLGRKCILLFSAVGMAVSEISLGVYSYLKDHNHMDMSRVSYLPLVLMTCFIITYNTGYGPLPWSMLGELFPPRVKSIATSSVTSINWILAFFITKHFEAMIKAFGIAQYFWIFGGCCLVAAAFAKFYVIETRGKSLQQIQEALNR
ncbi:hypothetical protein NQ318_017943 [Aromia moschata]|uniref:Major facilitator superfamily (MFS) profile domain-containing protein n=1 Tax=Aromia moschata TaxID=1265417 RepID=A0AAV8Y4E8_9CUCU|nr:hypothetical protein NQ318_017943 [Aromia moschata]